MVEFMNDILSVYKVFVDFFLSFSMDGIIIGYVVIACFVLGGLVKLVLGR